MTTPEELAETVNEVEALVSDDARYVTGVTLPVDAASPTRSRDRKWLDE
jgi:NAD(P)-dependent dehydrogenase (short-subunit alcohol dehydrogenase family)